MCHAAYSVRIYAPQIRWSIPRRLSVWLWHLLLQGWSVFCRYKRALINNIVFIREKVKVLKRELKIVDSTKLCLLTCNSEWRFRNNCLKGFKLIGHCLTLMKCINITLATQLISTTAPRPVLKRPKRRLWRDVLPWWQVWDITKALKHEINK